MVSSIAGLSAGMFALYSEKFFRKVAGRSYTSGIVQERKKRAFIDLLPPTSFPLAKDYLTQSEIPRTPKGCRLAA